MNITENHLANMYDDLLDADDWIEINGKRFARSTIIKNCDPAMYRVGMNQYADSLIRDGYTIENY